VTQISRAQKEYSYNWAPAIYTPLYLCFSSFQNTLASFELITLLLTIYSLMLSLPQPCENDFNAIKIN